MNSDTAIHVPYTVPVQKMDTPTGLFAGRCRKCDYAGGPTSERDAYRDATQHADAKNAAEKRDNAVNSDTAIHVPEDDGLTPAVQRQSKESDAEYKRRVLDAAPPLVARAAGVDPDVVQLPVTE